MRGLAVYEEVVGSFGVGSYGGGRRILTDGEAI